MYNILLGQPFSAGVPVQPSKPEASLGRGSSVAAKFDVGSGPPVTVTTEAVGFGEDTDVLEVVLVALEIVKGSDTAHMVPSVELRNMR